jgi:hypothetical protein
MHAPALADLLPGLDDPQVDAVANATASDFGGTIGAYERDDAWTAALYDPATRTTLAVDGLPTRRAALVALILEHEAQSKSS